MVPVRPTVPLVTSSRLSFLEVLPTSCSTQWWWCWCWPESAVIAAVLTVVSGHSVQSVSFLSNSRRMIRLEVLNCFGSEVLHSLCYNALPTCSHPPHRGWKGVWVLWRRWRLVSPSEKPTMPSTLMWVPCPYIRSAWGSSEMQTGRRKDGSQDLRDWIHILVPEVRFCSPNGTVYFLEPFFLRSGQLHTQGPASASQVRDHSLCCLAWLI